MKPSDLLIIYRKNSHWHFFSFTSGYKLLKRDKVELVRFITEKKKVKPEDVKFLKFKEIVGEEAP